MVAVFSRNARLSRFFFKLIDQPREEETSCRRGLRGHGDDAAVQAGEGVRVHHGQQPHPHLEQLPRDRRRPSKNQEAQEDNNW